MLVLMFTHFTAFFVLYFVLAYANACNEDQITYSVSITYPLKSSVRAVRSNLNVLPFCVIFAEQIQLIYNVSIKLFSVAEHYAFLGVKKFEHSTVALDYKEYSFVWTQSKTMAQWHAYINY